MIEQTIQELRHDDAAVRYEAARKLGESKDARAVEHLIAALPDDNSKVQYACVSGLVKIGHTSAVTPIIELLLEQPSSRIWELMKLNIGMRLRHGLMDMIEAGDTELADRLVTALDNVTLDETQQGILLQMIGRTADTRHTDLLLGRLERDTVISQSAAIEALGWLADVRAVEPLLTLITHDDSTLREVSTEALGRIGDGRAYDALISALSDSNEWVRRAAAEALGRLGDKRAMAALVHAVDDEDTMVQDAAFESIKKLSDTSFGMVI